MIYFGLYACTTAIVEHTKLVLLSIFTADLENKVSYSGNSWWAYYDQGRYLRLWPGDLRDAGPAPAPH